MIVAIYDPDQDILLRRVAPLNFFEEDSDKLDLLGILELLRILNLHVLGAEISEKIVSELESSGLRSQIEARNVLDFYLIRLLLKVQEINFSLSLCLQKIPKSQ